MSMKMGNCSRDTMADRAITKPKSFPKCSEGNLGRDKAVPASSGTLPPSRGLASLGESLSVAPVYPCPRPALTSPAPTHTPTQPLSLHLCGDYQTTEHREGTV